ncbi:hypothetical protein RJ640_005237 [Escallonia rubra]|uniref:Protein EXECUTER 2, chloroplastic n=1 Tax=Escallonia rubra TaxID=112253 RepID=A0AA88QSL2_9ASTE|nr:hypothetical protein RJ640_005237 [Escallonia rubra]
MAVANAWATAQSAQFRPSQPQSCSLLSVDCSIAKKYVNLRYVLGWGWRSVPQTTLNRLRSNSKLNSCRCVANSNGTSNASSFTATPGSSSCSSSSDWDWSRWTRHFSEIEQAESFASVLKFQLEDAIEKEDFVEAANLKKTIAEATSKDSIAEIMSQLKSAIDEERYHDASRLCRGTGSGLVGWWVGYSKDSDDPFGRLIQITPGVGRFVGKSYSPSIDDLIFRQLVNSSPGTPLFEIFVVKDADETYSMQVVFLQRVKTKPTGSLNSKLTKGPSAEIKNASVIDVKLNDEKSEKSDEKGITFEGATEEGIRSVINFLKDKIPELKVKVMKVDVTEEVIENSDSVKNIMEDDDESITSGESSEDEDDSVDEIQSDRVALGGGNDATEDGKNLDMKLFIGGVLHNKEDTPSKDEYNRVPAGIEDIERDSFVLHVPVRSPHLDTEESTQTKIKVAAIAAQGVSELMPPDVAKAFFTSDKVSPKVSRDVREIVKLAVSQAQKRERLSEYTSFSRITTSGGDLDPFDGLYVGAFGPYGTEVVQLRRKYGNWNGVNDTKKSSDVDFFEYVEAVKLTGDLNVPAGKVTFRAKIGKGNRLSSRGTYLDDLGVVGSYKGQGRIAEFGFRNPKWVEGELLQLNGKGMGPYVRGADLGFLYVVPEQSFLVLFNRLKLPN